MLRFLLRNLHIYILARTEILLTPFEIPSPIIRIQQALLAIYFPSSIIHRKFAM